MLRRGEYIPVRSAVASVRQTLSLTPHYPASHRQRVAVKAVDAIELVRNRAGVYQHEQTVSPAQT